MSIKNDILEKIWRVSTKMSVKGDRLDSWFLRLSRGGYLKPNL